MLVNMTPAAAHISGFNVGTSRGVAGPNLGSVTTVPWHRPPISQWGYHGGSGRGGPAIRRRK
jgi:hypothetical protein